MTPRRWALAFGFVLALAFAYDVWRIPVQVSDSLGDLLEAQVEPSMGDVFHSGLEVPGFLRPLKAVQTRVASDLSGGHYTAMFRTIHVVLLGVTIWALVLVFQVRTGADLAAAAFALTVFLGIHTFGNLLREAYPINHFLEVMLLALVCIRLAQAEPRWWNDVIAVSALVVASLIVESGLLIWVALIAARLSGMRGVSWRGLVVATALLGVYVYVRLFALSTGVPNIDERSSAMWLRILEPDELLARFGTNPLPFFAYNVGAAFASVLLAEPRAGLWVTAAAFVEGDVWPWMIVAVVSSTLTTGLVLAAVVSAWRDREGRDDGDRLFFIAAAVVAANAVVTYAYLKDDLMSLGGGFYALAAFAAMRRLIRRSSVMRPVVAFAVALVMAVAATGWATRTAGLHYSLRYTAFKTRNDWTSVEPRWSARPAWRVVTERIRLDALERPSIAPRFFPAWEARWFEE